jgi:general secretion pathway protein B
MSYILDALRKSEQQRQRGESPLLFTTQISSNVEKQPALLIYGLVAIILICAGILIGWLHPWQQDKSEIVNSSIVLTQHEAKPRQIAVIPLSITQAPEKVRKPELALPVQKSISTIELASETVTMKQGAPTPFKIEVKTPKSEASSATPKAQEQLVHKAALANEERAIPTSIEHNGTSSSTEIAKESTIIAMAELPLAIQQEIPMMTISGYAYSSVPKERSVGINDRLLQEGEFLAPGLRLEQISADGLVFSYKKYLFRHNL